MQSTGNFMEKFNNILKMHHKKAIEIARLQLIDSGLT